MFLPRGGSLCVSVKEGVSVRRRVSVKGDVCERVVSAVADPGFPRGGGANSPGGGANIRFCQNFPKTA